MFNLRNFVLLFALLTLASATAGASTIVFLGDPQGANAPYTLTINGVQVTAPCISDDITVAGTWQATEASIVDFSNVIPTGNFSSTVPNPGGTTTETNLLEEAVWLDAHIGTEDVTTMQYAIWDLGETISGIAPKYTDSSTKTLLTTAASSYLSGETYNFYAGYSLLIPQGGSGTSPDTWPNPNPPGGTESQFFLIAGPPTISQTPEPGTMLMLGSALILLGCVGKRHRKN